MDGVVRRGSVRRHEVTGDAPRAGEARVSTGTALRRFSGDGKTTTRSGTTRRRRRAGRRGLGVSGTTARCGRRGGKLRRDPVVTSGVVRLHERGKEGAHTMRTDERKRGDQETAAETHRFVGDEANTAAEGFDSGERFEARQGERERGKGGNGERSARGRPCGGRIGSGGR